MAGLSGVPIIILKEGSKRESGKDAQRKNILAAKAVAESIRTTLGPKGMDKMLIAGEEATITNDGATILREMDIEHPVAKMIVEVAKAQDDEIGDGTTTAVIIAGKLLEKAEGLLDQDVHPTVIVQGYKQAAARAQKVLSEMAVDVSADEATLSKIARTAMLGKGIEMAMDKLAMLSVEAAQAIAGFEGKDIEENIATASNGCRTSQFSAGGIRPATSQNSQCRAPCPCRAAHLKQQLISPVLWCKQMW